MPKIMKRTIQGFRFEWEGGEYIEIIRVGEPYAFDTINTQDRDGKFPEFTRANFLAQIEEFKQGLKDETPDKYWLKELRFRARETYDI